MGGYGEESIDAQVSALRRGLAAAEQEIARLGAVQDDLSRTTRAMSTPWFWQNPLANKLARGSITSSQLGVTQETFLSASDFTTTNTTDWQSVGTTLITIPSGTRRVAIYVWTAAQASHSVANAEMSLRILLYTDAGLGTAYVLGLADHVILPATATKQIAPIVLNHGLNVGANLPLVVPGSRTLQLAAFNHTTGTLTLPGATSTNIFHALLTGDSTA